MLDRMSTYVSKKYLSYRDGVPYLDLSTSASWCNNDDFYEDVIFSFAEDGCIILQGEENAVLVRDMFYNNVQKYNYTRLHRGENTHKITVLRESFCVIPIESADNSQVTERKVALIEKPKKKVSK
jgi:hypothetical protein